MTKIKRLNYFTAQFLTEKDFNEQQQYHIEKHRLHNQWLHSWGVADGGLQVGKRNDKQITISQGIAIDKDGNEIVLLEPATHDLTAFAANATAWVTVKFGIDKEPAEDLYKPDGAKNYTRWTELPVIASANVAPVTDGSVILLATVKFDANGKISTIDNGVRRLAGAASSSGMRIVGPPRTAGANTLDVQGGPRSTGSGSETGNHPTGLALYVTADSQHGRGGVQFRHSNGTQGIGFAYNMIYATGPFTDQPLNLKAFGNGTVTVEGDAAITGTLAVNVIAPNGAETDLPLKLNAKGTGGVILTGDTTVNGSLESRDNATLTKNLTVKGAITGDELKVEAPIKAKSIEADSLKVSNQDLFALVRHLQAEVIKLQGFINDRISSTHEGQMRVVRGTYYNTSNSPNSVVTKRVGLGFDIARQARGIFVISFKPPFSAEPSASVNQIWSDENSMTTDNAIIRKISPNEMRIATGDGAGTRLDRDFSFVVVGPQ